jgi:hypothetical protein
LIRTSGDRTELMAFPPLMMHPAETIESISITIPYPTSPKKNLAGGYWRWYVRMGQSRS